MGFFLVSVLRDFEPLLELRGDLSRVERYRAERDRLVRAIEAEAWDGAWYRRGTYDDGTWLGSASSDECRIDALAQSWAVLSGVAPPDRLKAALDSVERELVVPDVGIVKLLAPPFEHTAHDPGYIKGYVPGVRENGGQYTHAALWFVRALAEAGRRDRAAHLLEALSPVSHSSDAAQVARYQVEPYVIAADVYGAEPHVGRGGWTWYTGSAGWMIRVGLESILGLTQEAGTRFVLAPCVPDAWPGYSVTRRLEEGTTYEFQVARGGGRSEVVVSAKLDGVELEPADGRLVVPIVRDGGRHVVHAILGEGA
jgi:cyclic beta-1,2-glucan synthetase